MIKRKFPPNVPADVLEHTKSDVPIFTEMTITPQLAKQWLETNRSRHKESRIVLFQYTKKIENEQWIRTKHTIKFDKKGKLIDGKHRLKAVVKAKKPIVNMILFSPEEEKVFISTQ